MPISPRILDPLVCLLKGAHIYPLLILLPCASRGESHFFQPVPRGALEKLDENRVKREGADDGNKRDQRRVHLGRCISWNFCAHFFQLAFCWCLKRFRRMRQEAEMPLTKPVPLPCSQIRCGPSETDDFFTPKLSIKANNHFRCKTGTQMNNT